MALGPFAFEAHGFSFTDRDRDQKTPWAEMSVAGGMNPHQWTGGNGASEKIKGVLFPAEFGGEATLNGVYSAAKSGQVLPLVSFGSFNVGGMWFIDSVSEDHGFIDRFGQPHRDAYSINLSLYVGGSFQPLSVLTGLF